MKTFLPYLLLGALALGARAEDPLPANPNIDYPGFLRIVAATESPREQGRLTEEQFLEAMKEPGVVILDARSREAFGLRHVKGAVNLPFPDFTDEALAKIIPQKTTRILIYCNNNFGGSPRAFAMKRVEASLNVNTQVALRTYGYTRVHELAPFLQVGQCRIPFEGQEVEGGAVKPTGRLR